MFIQFLNVLGRAYSVTFIYLSLFNPSIRFYWYFYLFLIELNLKHCLRLPCRRVHIDSTWPSAILSDTSRSSSRPRLFFLPSAVSMRTFPFASGFNSLHWHQFGICHLYRWVCISLWSLWNTLKYGNLHGLQACCLPVPSADLALSLVAFLSRPSKANTKTCQSQHDITITSFTFKDCFCIQWSK